MLQQDGTRIFCRISQLPDGWQRQIYQAAIEQLKSNINLEEYVQKETRAWKIYLSKLKNIPDIAQYDVIAPRLEQLLGEHVALNRLTPAKLISVLSELGGAGERWRSVTGTTDITHFALNPNLVASAQAWVSCSDHTQKKTRMTQFRRDLAAIYPETWALLDTHQTYKRLTGRQPQEPSLTVSSAYENPKHVMWSAAQYREFLLPGEGINAVTDPRNPRVMVSLPTLQSGPNGIVEVKNWFSISGDPRLIGLRRAEGAKPGATTGLEQQDLVTGRWHPVDLGAVRLVPSKIGKKKLAEGDLSAADFKIKVTVNREVAEPPKWVGEDLGGKARAPITHEPRLPEKLLVVSFLSDLMGPATLRAAVVEPAAYGKRKITWLSNEKFIAKAELATDRNGKAVSIASPADVIKVREGIQRLTDLRLKLSALLFVSPKGQEEIQIPLKQLKTDLVRRYEIKLAAGQITKDLPNDTLVTVSRREIRHEIRRIRRTEALSWDRVTKLGEMRANGFAGEVARRIERLRMQYPDYQIAFVMEHRQERSASKAVWSKAFNRLVMSSGGANIHNKIKETCSRLDPPIGVFERSIHGLSACDLAQGNADVRAFAIYGEYEGKSGRLPQLAPWSLRSLVMSQRPKAERTQVQVLP